MTLRTPIHVWCLRAIPHVLRRPRLPTYIWWRQPLHQLTNYVVALRQSTDVWSEWPSYSHTYYNVIDPPPTNVWCRIPTPTRTRSNVECPLLFTRITLYPHMFNVDGPSTHKHTTLYPHVHAHVWRWWLTDTIGDEVICTLSVKSDIKNNCVLFLLTMVKRLMKYKCSTYY